MGQNVFLKRNTESVSENKFNGSQKRKKEEKAPMKIRKKEIKEINVCEEMV